MRSLIIITVMAGCILQSCSSSRKTTGNIDSSGNKVVLQTRTSKNNIPARIINTKKVNADSVVEFALTLTGIKYKYGSAKKEEGFDCSGLITYVFKHFNIQVPRTSVQFTNAGTTINPTESKRGDLVLFTGSDYTGWIVGHMGIITENKKGNIKFIHSASGNSRGVMISDMNSYFVTRFVKVIRIFD